VRILVLDALDQIGGHARRNEFVSRSGKRLVGYGGSQSLDTPGLFSTAVQTLLRELGIDLSRFKSEFYDAGWARRHGLAREGVFFGREVWAEDRLVVREEHEDPALWVARTPMPAAARADLLRLFGPPAGNSSCPACGRSNRRY